MEKAEKWFFFKYDGEQLHSTVELLPKLLFFFLQPIIMLILINCIYGSTITKVVPTQTGLSHCFIIIAAGIYSYVGAKFMVVLWTVFTFCTKRLQEVVQRNWYND